jgi:hypothetical protein
VAKTRVCTARNFFDSDAKWASPGLSEMWDSDCLGDGSGQHSRSQTRLMECVSSCGKSQDNRPFDSTTTFDRLMQGWLRCLRSSCWAVAHRLRLPLLLFCGRAPAVEAICVWQQFGSADKGCETCRPQLSAHLFDKNKVGVGRWLVLRLCWQVAGV